MATKVIMPQLGESVVEGTVNLWLKKVGDSIQEYEPLVEISTDKVTSEVTAPASGIILEILIQEEETVQAGTVLCIIGQAGEVSEEKPKNRPLSSPHENGSDRDSRAASRLSPVVARMLSEHQVDLSQIRGTGLGGRVTKKDIETYLASKGKSTPSIADLPPWEQPGSGDLFKPTPPMESPKASPSPTPPLGKGGESQKKDEFITTVPQRLIPPEPVFPASGGELIKLNAMRRSIADHMVQSQLHIAPHVSTIFEVDLTNTLAHLNANKPDYAKQGVNLTLTAYFIQAMVAACRVSPIINSEWRSEGIYIHHHVHVGLAVAIDDGLIVPVIRHAEDLNLIGLARRINDLAQRARAKQLKADEIQGSTITITNHGVSGSLVATPIINQPNTAIFGVGMMEKRVKVINDAIAIRPCAYISLTFDHRVADGATGDAWMVAVKRHLEGI